MANEVVWYDSDEVGAPTLNNVAGSLDAVLYACLVTGFRVQTLTSITVASGVATAVLAGHGYADQRMLEISGATPAGLNGRKLVTVPGAGTFTFDATGVADGVASGTITAKRSPLGWVRDVTTGNVSIYKRSDPAATLQGLRLDDSGAGVASATHARVTMLETWTDVNTFTGQAPTPAQLSGGQYICKGADTAAAKRWVLVGDSRFLYLFTEGAFAGGSFASFGGLHMQWFGDPVSYRAGDAYGSILAALPSSSSDITGSGSTPYPFTTSGNAANVAWSRAAHQIGGPVGGLMVTSAPGGYPFGYANGGPAFPSYIDNGMVLTQPVHLTETNAAFGNPIRGEMPGLAYPMTQGARALHKAILPNVIGSTRKYLGVAVLGGNGSSNTGLAVIDVTGPWR